MGTRTLNTYKPNIKARCIDDKKVEHFGFLYLKKRFVKDDRITQGKIYPLICTEHVDFGNQYCGPVLFETLHIIDDNNCRQIFDLKQFELIDTTKQIKPWEAQ